MARYFDDMNREGGEVCPLCGTDKPGKVLLVPIPGTQEGNITQAKQFHRDCAWEVGAAFALAEFGQAEIENSK